MDVQPHGEPAARDHRLGCRPAAAGRLRVGDLHGPEHNRGIRQRHTRPEPVLHAALAPGAIDDRREVAPRLGHRPPCHRETGQE